MRPLNVKSYLLTLLTLVLLAACSSGGSNSPASADGAPPTQGKAVDPYIVGAVFQEVTATGSVLQDASSPSDSQGNFSFPLPLHPGSIVEMKVNDRGTHNGISYQGLLKAKVPVTGNLLVVSPLTTLLANGATEQEVVSFLGLAGMTGITTADLRSDPMAGLENLHSGEVTDNQLQLLQAAMAVNAFMHIINNYAAGPMDLTNSTNALLMTDLVGAAKKALNQAEFEQLAAALASDQSTAGQPMLLADAIHMAADAMQTMASLADSGTIPSTAAIMMSIDGTLTTAVETTRNYMLARLGIPSPSPTPDGSALYADNCAACHGALAGSSKAGATAAQIQGAIASVSAMQSFATLSAAEVQAIADALAGTTTPPAPAVDGAALYTSDCAACHGALASSAKAGATAAQIQGAIAGVSAMQSFATLSAAEVQAIADALAGTTTPPAPAVDGAALYTSDCAACHGALASSAKAGATAAQIQGAIASVGAMQSFATLSAAEVQAIADALATSTPPTDGGTTPACGSCHGLPPDGTSVPNTAGAHSAHQALADVGTNCDTCHSDHIHQNGAVEIGILASFNAKSGAATDSPDGTATCANVSCHGGQTTPFWGSGSIDVNTQCESCHAYGTAQFNSYSSGRHSLHVGQRHFACTVCHETGKLAVNHFTSLATTDMEGPASATIGGGATRVTSYTPATRSCSPSCHSRETW